MSLEAAIQENTATMRELIDALKAQPAPATTQVAEAETKQEKPKAKKKAQAKKQEKPAEESPKNDGIAGDPPVDQPSYEEAAEAITTLAKTKGRDAAVAVLKTFGVAKLPEAKEEQFADIIAACEAA